MSWSSFLLVNYIEREWIVVSTDIFHSCPCGASYGEHNILDNDLEQ